MNLANVRVDDIVRCDVKGRQFLAIVTEAAHDGALSIKPITRDNHFTATSRQVVEHWRKAGRPRHNRKLEQGT